MYNTVQTNGTELALIEMVNEGSYFCNSAKWAFHTCLHYITKVDTSFCSLTHELITIVKSKMLKKLFLQFHVSK